MKKALVITPDMDLNGAQTVLSELLELLDDAYHISMITPTSGVFEAKYKKRGYDILVRPSVVGDKAFRRHIQNDYDLVFLNSSSVVPYVYFFINTDAKVVWWLHETEMQLRAEGNMINPYLLSDNIRILGVSEAVRSAISNMFGFKIGILPIPIAEGEKDEALDTNGEKTVFFIPAAYTQIKGQDILLKAISELSDDMINKSEFVFCGYPLPGQEEYYNSIKSIIEKLSNATDLGCIERSEVYKWYRRCDCVIAPSRADSNPASIIEGMMYKKHTIASSETGISHYMKDCENGFVFHDDEELLKRIMLIISDGKSLASIAEAGYELYRNRFSPEAVKMVLKDEGII